MKTRREFIRNSSLAAAGLMLTNFREKYQPRLDIGYTFITWGYQTEDLEPAMKGMAELGFHGFETFGQVLESYENNLGGIGPLIEKYKLPLKSAFCNINVIDKNVMKEEGDKLIRWAKLCKKYGGDVIEFNAGGGRPKGYKFSDHKTTIISAFNEYAKRVTDEGLTFAFHNHTGTPVETPEEVYGLMNNVDTRYVKFGPDVGQFKKGGGDPVKLMKDFISIVEHIHLKDYDGGQYYEGYAPLGMGEVRIKKILKMLEKSNFKGMVMGELDYSKTTPRPAIEAVRISKDYLAGLGYDFKS